MKKIIFLLLLVPGIALATTPVKIFQPTILPFVDDSYDLGTTTLRYRNLYLSGTCTGCGAGAVATFGTTSISAAYPLSWNTGTAQLSTIATSSLNLTTSSFLSGNVSQWTNNSGYLTSLSGAASSTLLGDFNTFTNLITGNVSGNSGTVTNGVYTTSFGGLFDNRLSATTSVKSITTLSSLSITKSQVSDFGSYESPLTFNYPLSRSVNAISTVATSSLGLTVSSFASANISQWTNNSNYLTSLSGAASSTLLGDVNTWTNTQTMAITGNSGTVTNGVYTTTFNGLFDNRLSASTSISSIATLSNLSSINNYTGLIAGSGGKLYQIATSSAVNMSISGNAASLSAVLANTLGGTGKDSSGFTGIAGISSGVWYAIATSSALNTSITGNAATVTTNANLSGVVTSSGNTTSYGSQSAGVLGNSATGNTGVMATSTLFGNPTGGSILAFLSGANTWVSTTTLNIGGNAATVTTNANLTGIVTSVGNATSCSTCLTTSLTKGNFIVGNDSGVAQATTTIFISSTGKVGIGSTTPAYTLGVIGTFAVATSSGQGLPNFSIDGNGHLVTSGTKPAITTCGAGSPAITGNDQAGVITTGTAPTSCTITFANTYTTAPACVISGAPASGSNVFKALISSTTATTLNIMASSTGAIGATMPAWLISYICLKTQ